MDNNMINLEVDKDLIANIMTKQIQTAIAANMGNPEEFIQNVIGLALRQKVNSDGNVGRYSSDNKYDYIEVLARQNIKKIAQNLMEEWIEENADLLKDTLKKELSKKSSMNRLTKAYMTAFENSLSATWNFKADIKFVNSDD